MTIGQVAAGGIAVGPRAAFAPTTAGLGSNPKKDSAFPAPAEADGKPFSFHFRSKSNGAALDAGSSERNSSRRREAFGASRGTSRDTTHRKQQPDVARPDNDTALSATPLTSTALETARKIVRTLQTTSRAADNVTTSEAESHPATETRSAALQALIEDMGKPGEIPTTTAFAKLESLGQAATHGIPIEQSPAGLLASDADNIPHVEQGTGPAFSGRGADDPSSDLAVPSGSPHPAQGKERNPVENLRVTTEIEAADLVSTRTLAAQKPDNQTHRLGLPLLLHRKIGSDDDESTRQYLHEDHRGENRVSAKADTAVEQEIARVAPKPPRLDEASPGRNTLNADLAGGYRAIQPRGNEGSVAGVPGPSNHSEPLPEAAAELSNTTSAGPKSGPRLSHVEVPTGPQGNAAEKAVSLPLSAAHFSLRPAQRRGDEGVSGGISSRRFSTGNPQEEAAHLRASVDLKAEYSARESQSDDAGSSRPPRNVRVNAAESHLTENDLKSARVASRSAATAPEGTAGVATSSQIRPIAAASPGRLAGSAHAQPEATQHREGQIPSSRQSPALTASELTRANVNVDSSRQAVAPITRAEANLAASSQAAVPLAAVIRRERGQQDGRPGSEFAQTPKGQDSTEQQESQSLLLKAVVSKSDARAARGNDQGQPFPNGRSGSEKSDASRSDALPAAYRSAGNMPDAASQTLLRPAELSPRGPTALSRPAEPSNRVPDSHLSQVRAVERVVEMASLQKNADSNQMNIVMRDSHLGWLSLRLVERNGLIETLLRTDSSRTGQLIGEKLPQMLEALSQRGFDASQHGSGQWTGSQQDQRQGGQQRPPRPAARQGQRGSGAEHVFQLEVDS